MSKYEVDIFLHSQEVEHQQKILDLYKPTDFNISVNPDFSNYFKDVHTSLYDESISGGLVNIFSMMYSRYISGLLKKQHETRNNFLYDWVIFSRFDVSNAHIPKFKFVTNNN